MGANARSGMGILPMELGNMGETPMPRHFLLCEVVE